MDTNINSTKRTDIYSVDPRNVVVVDNFNVRSLISLLTNSKSKSSCKAFSIPSRSYRSKMRMEMRNTASWMVSVVTAQL